MKILHKHHIIPRHMTDGVYDNSLDNITPPISISLHAALHKDLYEHYGNTEDFIAWKTLLGLSLKGIIFTPEVRKKISEAGKGRKHTEEFKHKLGEANSKRVWKESSKQKNREAQQGRKHSEETKKKISETVKGRKRKPCSEETRKKISEAHKGKFLSKDHKKKIGISSSKALKGHKVSEETKKKISESCMGRIAWNKGLKKNVT